MGRRSLLGAPIGTVMSWLSRGRERLRRHMHGGLYGNKLPAQECDAEENQVRAADRSVEENDLHARIDGRLPPQRAEAVNTYFATHPEQWEQWWQYAEQREALRAALAAQAREPIPRRLHIANLMASRRRRHRRELMGIAAAVALLIFGGIGGWSARDVLPGLASWGSAQFVSAVFDDAIAAHCTFSVETGHPVEVGANEETHLVQWLSKRLGHRLLLILVRSASG